jgi:hypothetical protein
VVVRGRQVQQASVQILGSRVMASMEPATYLHGACVRLASLLIISATNTLHLFIEN